MTRGVRIAVAIVVALVLVGGGRMAMAAAPPDCGAGCERTEPVEAWNRLVDPTTGVCVDVHLTGTLSYRREPLRLGAVRYVDAQVRDTRVVTRFLVSCDSDLWPEVEDVTVVQVFGATRDAVRSLSDELTVRASGDDGSLAPTTGRGSAVGWVDTVGSPHAPHTTTHAGSVVALPTGWRERAGLTGPPCVWTAVGVGYTRVDGAGATGSFTPLRVAFCASDA